MIMEEWKHGRNFLLAVAEQTLKVKSFDEIKEIVKLCFENVDTNLSLKFILSYLVFAVEFDTENIVLEQVPGESVYKNGVWVFKQDEEETQNLFNNLKW